MTAGDTPLKRALRGDRTVMRSNGSPMVVTRTLVLDDIVVRSRAQGGDGRTVDAYAAVFNDPTEIKDSDGHYNEQNDPTAFNQSISERAGKIFCIYNHGRSLGGMPSDMWSVPLGVPIPGAMRADSHGLFTSTRYNPDPESDRILEAIKSGSLRGMSYTGVFLRSNPELSGPYERYGPLSGGDLPLVTRQEIALIEYGPTPIPAYQNAQVAGVRSDEVTETPARERIEIHLHGLTTATTTPVCTTSTGTTTVPVEMTVTESSTEEPARPRCEDCNGTGKIPAERAGVGSGYKMPGNIDSSDKTNTDTVIDDPSITCPMCLGTGMADPAEAEDAAEDAADQGVDEASEAELPEEMPLDKLVDGGGSPVKAKAKGTGIKIKISSSDERTPEEDERDRADKGTGDKKPYGNVEYADPKNGKYPIDEKHVEAAWSYINQPDNAAKYPLNGVSLSSVKSKIAAAMKKYGHKISDTSSRSSGRHPAAATSREAGKGTGSHNRAPNAEPRSIRPPSTAGDNRMDPEGRMTVEERMARQADVRSRLAEIDTEYMGAELPGEVRTEWRQLQEELVVHDRAIADASARADYLNSIAENPNAGNSESVTDQGYDGGGGSYLPPRQTEYLPPRRAGQAPAPRSTTFYNPDKNIWDMVAIRQRARSFDEMPMLYREYAMRAVDGARFSAPNKNREDCQETVAKLLDTIDDNQATLARRVLATGSPVYDRAFGKLLQSLGTASLTTEEAPG